MSAPGHNFRQVRFLRSVNLLAQALLFLSLFAGLNYLASSYAWRFDLTQHRRHSLSPETVAYLANLSAPVQVVVTLTEDAENPEISQAYRDLRGLLREYTTATRNSKSGRIAVTYLDVYQNRRESERLNVEQANSVVVICRDKRRVVALSEFYDIANGAKKAFVGERAITAAILDVSSAEKSVVYFLTGHGEMRPDDTDGLRGLSVLRDELRARNFELGVLDLSVIRAVPEDANLLIVAAPQGRFEPAEEELLRRYMNTRAGRIILLIEPGRTHGLDNLLYDWGVQADDDWVLDNNRQNVTETGDLRITAFLADHPITKTLIDFGNIPLLLGPTRSVRADPGRALDANLRVSVLAATGTTAWGERSYRQRVTPAYDPEVDLRGLPNVEPINRLGVLVAAERVTPPREQLPFSIRGGRMVVFGSADFAANDRLSSPGSHIIVLNAINWSIDRDLELNIPPRPIEQYQLSLSQDRLVQLRYTLLLVIPGVAALFGLIVYWTRRQ